MTPERHQKILDVLKLRQPDLTVIADSVHKGRNIAAIRRSCDAMGVGDMHAVIPDDFEQRRFAGTTMGSHKWVRLHQYDNITEAVSRVKQNGMKVVAAQLGEGAKDFREIDFTQPTAILMGAEISGVSDDGIALTDEIFSIPMLGMVESYNVSVACALILNEAIRQRIHAGQLEQVKLSESEIQTLIFEWGYPKLASFYSARSMPYPALDEQGQLII